MGVYLMTELLVIADGLEVLKKIIPTCNSSNKEGFRKIFAMTSRNVYFVRMVETARDMVSFRDVRRIYRYVHMANFTKNVLKRQRKLNFRRALS